MNSFLHNPIADMYGRDFLVFYGCVIAITLVVCWQLIQDPSKNQPLPLIPTEPDVYAIAYLRFQAAGIADLVLFNLVLHGYLQVNKQSISQVVNHGDVSHLQPIEQAVLNQFAVPATATTSLWLASQCLKPYSDIYKEQLQSEKLLSAADWEKWKINVGLMGATIIFSLGGYKLLVALSKGNHNVGFLINMGILSIICLYWLVSKRSHLSERGQKYLQQLQQTFAQLKSSAKLSNASAIDYNLLVALFGVKALAGTAYDFYHQAFFPPVLTTSRGSNSSGSSCSSSSCGGSSSCSSSSCGGGCGGCGGGD